MCHQDEAHFHLHPPYASETYRVLNSLNGPEEKRSHLHLPVLRL